MGLRPRTRELSGKQNFAGATGCKPLGPGRFLLRDMNKTDLPIASPCNVPWTSLVGSDATRFCGTCQQHVHDLSTMTRSAARALLTGPSTAGLCVRYLHDDEGTIMF